jgi:hypothetical protein
VEDTMANEKTKEVKIESNPDVTLESRVDTSILRQEIESRIKTMKEDVYREVESELKSDPQVAGAIQALESIKKIVRPFIVESDIEEVINANEKKIKAYEEESAGLKKKLAESEKGLEESLVLNKTLANKLYIREKIKDEDLEIRNQVIESIGDVDHSFTPEKIDKMVSSLLPVLKKNYESQEIKEHKKVSILNQDIERLTAEVDKLTEESDKLKVENKEIREKYKTLIEESENMNLKVYAMRKAISEDNKESMLKLITEGRITTTEEVDKRVLAEDTERDLHIDIGGDSKDKIKRGVNHLNEDREEGGNSKMFGHRVSDMLRLAGVEK